MESKAKQKVRTVSQGQECVCQGVSQADTPQMPQPSPLRPLRPLPSAQGVARQVCVRILPCLTRKLDCLWVDETVHLLPIPLPPLPPPPASLLYGICFSLRISFHLPPG